jgi:hypothetical protein
MIPKVKKIDEKEFQLRSRGKKKVAKNTAISRKARAEKFDVYVMYLFNSLFI